MADLTSYPLQDGYETTLAQSRDGSTGTVYLNSAPDFTFPSGVTTYIVVNPGKTTMQVAEINAVDTGADTVTVSNITIEKGASVNYSQQTHGVNSIVRISDSYEFRKDIATSLGTKVDKDEDSLIADAIELQFGSTSAAVYSDDTGTNLSFKDGSNPAVTLSTLASGGGADTKVAVSVNDTTTSVLDSKLTAGDGLSKTIVNPAGAETLDFDIDTSDTTIFVKTSSGAGDEDKVPVLDSDGKIAGGVIPSSAADVTFGDGSDGDVIITTTVTLTRDMYYENLTITSPGILNPDGYRVYVRNILSGDGKIQRNGIAGGDGGDGGDPTGGAAGMAGTTLGQGNLDAEPTAGAGGKGADENGTGVNGVAGESGNPTYVSTNGTAGGRGGRDGLRAFGAGGVGGTSTRGSLYNIATPRQFFDMVGPASFIIDLTQYLAGSGCGGGGGGSEYNGSQSGGGGGGAGSNGGFVWASINTVNWTGTWEMIGGDGGDGGDAAGGTAGGGGGGAGGNGGTLYLIYNTLTSIGTKTFTGGTGGAIGSGGSLTVAGTAGNTGTSIEISI